MTEDPRVYDCEWFAKALEDQGEAIANEVFRSYTHYRYFWGDMETPLEPPFRLRVRWKILAVKNYLRHVGRALAGKSCLQ